MFGAATDKRVFDFSKVVEVVQRSDVQSPGPKSKVKIWRAQSGFNVCNKCPEEMIQDQTCDFGLWTWDFGLMAWVRS